jgi:hypothetical protein
MIAAAAQLDVRQSQFITRMGKAVAIVMGTTVPDRPAGDGKSIT